MFCGIVEKMGRVVKAGKKLVVETGWDDLVHGESVAVNGTCLTVVRNRNGRADFDVVRETLKKTNLGDLKRGSKVNLERSLRVGDRISGHFVQGHVDGTGCILQRGTTMRVESPLSRELVPKGSVAVDGVSLTVVDVDPGSFTIALIPTTLRLTTLGRVRRGDRVNLEIDILSKYVRNPSSITEEFLAKAGY